MRHIGTAIPMTVGATAKRIENYLPLVGQVHQWKDRKKMVELVEAEGL